MTDRIKKMIDRKMFIETVKLYLAILALMAVCTGLIGAATYFTREKTLKQCQQQCTCLGQKD